jgi:hypothetical protein
MKDLGITKGEWKVDEEYLRHKIEINNSTIHLYHTVVTFNGTMITYNEAKSNALLIADAGNTAQKCGLLPSELLRQRDELKEELAEQKRLYFKLFDEEISCMYCEAKIRRGSAIILCKECAENTEV